MKYKTYTIPDNEIDVLVDALDISINEACEMWLSDHDMIENETVEELTKKATKNRVTGTIHGAKGEKKERKAREKKENPLKKEIIQAIFKGIAENISTDGEIIVTNDEKYIDFNVNELEFTVNLVQHRKNKKQG